MLTRGLLGAAALGILSAPLSSAATVRFDWTGTVTYAVPALAGAGVVVGAPASGHYRFQGGLLDGDPDPQTGLYDQALLEWRVAVGSLDNTTTASGFGSIRLDLDVPSTGDVYLVQVGPALQLRLQDVDSTALSSDALPLTPPDVLLFEGRAVAQLDPNTLEPLAVIGLDTLSLHPPAVPLLPAWGPVAAALLMALASRHMRRAVRRRSV